MSEGKEQTADTIEVAREFLADVTMTLRLLATMVSGNDVHLASKGMKLANNLQSALN